LLSPPRQLIDCCVLFIGIIVALLMFVVPL
jgi:hypothetical protein